MSYSKQQDEILEQLGIRETTASLVQGWAALVDECESGHRWDVSELHNELGVRDRLELIIGTPDLARYPEHAELSAAVHGIDARFRGLLKIDAAIPGDRPWWRRGVLRFAGEEYVRYLAQAYGFHVETVPA